MKRLLILALLLAASPALADMTSTTLLNAVTTPGPSSAIYSTVSPAPSGIERWSFQLLATGSATARLEQSLNGTTWAPVHVVGPNAAEIYSVSACGPCRFRIVVMGASAGNTVTVFVTQTGLLVPTLTP